ncbi:MAG: HDOD domain-containing protein [Planctomycetota bacterium]
MAWLLPIAGVLALLVFMGWFIRYRRLKRSAQPGATVVLRDVASTKRAAAAKAVVESAKLVEVKKRTNSAPALLRGQVSADTSKKFEAWVADFPPLSPTARLIWGEVHSPNTNPKRLTEILSRDPIMTAKLLRMANSAFAAQQTEVTATERAVLLLGYDCILTLAYHETMGGAKRAQPGGYNETVLLRHNVATGLFAGALCRRMGRPNSAEAVTAGVIHDIGKQVMSYSKPELVCELLDYHTTKLGEPLLRKEERLFGASHAVIGAMLAEEWKLPATLAKAVELHHQPVSSTLADYPANIRELACIVFVANQLTKFVKWPGHDMEIDLPAPGLLASMKLPETYEEILKLVEPEVRILLSAFPT